MLCSYFFGLKQLNCTQITWRNRNWKMDIWNCVYLLTSCVNLHNDAIGIHYKTGLPLFWIESVPSFLRSRSNQKVRVEEDAYLPPSNYQIQFLKAVMVGAKRKWCTGNWPLEDQRPFHRCTSAEYLHPVAVIYQDEHKEWLSCKLSLLQLKL